MLYYVILAFMIFFPLFYFRAVKNTSWEITLKTLLPKPKHWKKELVGSVKLFALLFAAFILLAVILQLTGFNDLNKVDTVVAENLSNNAVWYILTIAVVVLIEEFFFRAFLQNVIGPIPATLVFTLAHFSYWSIAELIGVFALGLILAYWFKKNNSLMQNYLGHLFYNTVAILLYALL